MSGQSRVDYVFWDEYDIHEFIFHEATRKSLDDYMEYLRAIYPTQLANKPSMRVILDIHATGMLPIKYAQAVMDQLLTDCKPFPTTYIAYLTETNIDKSLITSLDYTAPKQINRMTFPYEKRDDAIAWLLTKV